MRQTNSEALFLLLVKAENRALVECLTSGGVEYVIVGSSALAFYGLREVTDVGDLDLLLNDTQDNARRVLSVLAIAGVPVNATAEQLARPYAQIKLKGTTGYWADLITPPEGMSFTSVWSDAASAKQGNLTLRVASKEHLIQMKKATIAAGGEDMEKHETDLARLLDA